MNKEKFLRAMTMIDDDLINESALSSDSEPEISDIPDSGTTVSGVEIYRRSVVWQRYAALAAAFIVVVGASTAGAFYLKNRGAPAPDVDDIITAAVTTTDSSDLSEEAAAKTNKEADNTESAETTPAMTGENESAVTKTPADEGNTKESNDITDNTDLNDSSDTHRPSALTTAHTQRISRDDTTKAANTATPPRTTDSVSGTINKDNIFSKLNALNYIPITCDGLPEYKLTSGDGAIYWLNFSSRWVWKNGADAEAVLPDEIISWLKNNRSSVTLETVGDIIQYPQPCDTFCTASVDWYCGGDSLVDDAWNRAYGQYSAVITSTNELRSYLSYIYRENVILQYLNKYDDSFFRENVLLLNTVQQRSGWGSRLVIDDFEFGDTITVNASWHHNEVEEEIVSLCLAHAELSREWYSGNTVVWNIS